MHLVLLFKIYDHTLHGTVCGFPILFPQYPRLTGTTDNLAKIIAPRMAVATSLEHLTPNPICPLESPIAKINTYIHY